MLDVLAMTSAVLADPIESITFVDDPFDYIRSIAKFGKGDKQFLLKLQKPSHPKTKVIYVYGPGAFFTFDVVKYEKAGYVVEAPRERSDMPKPEDVVGLRIAMGKVYDAYRKPDLPENCALRLQELEIESMQRIIKDSTPEQLQRLFDFAEDEDSLGDDDTSDAATESTETAPVNMSDTIEKLKESEGELDKESLIEAMQLLNDNFELAKYTLDQIPTTRRTVEAYFNMPVDILQDIPVSVVDIINDALQQALERTKHKASPVFTLDVESDEESEDLGK